MTEERNAPASRARAHKLDALVALKSFSAYALTGGFANGFFNELFVDRQPQAQTTSRALLHTVLRDSAWAFSRGAIRFGVFERTKSVLQHDDTTASLPVWAKGALSGASGGFAENAVQLVRDRRRPPLKAVATSTARTVFGFGTFTYLWVSGFASHEARETVNTEPPQPYWRCWSYAAAAGTVASAIVSSAKGLRGRALALAIARGTLMMGTVISVQVSFCAELLIREPFKL